ncbi:hypothetical protein Cfor_06571 [Coptotermes formosanus]|uniref:TRAF3-interacting protein 1 n=1 Tax=Coptotermes formosanus TaxID=36987 RepID=A0A6L2PEU4_COPFO|nr:hypothetical protein Cfor_06571 [Coptotermes formosanus]
MSDDIRPEVVKRTQDTLGKYIKKPPLTEKLLKKPPFRFLHDIIRAVIQETGFLQGLFTTEELNHETIKDRDSKIAFLQKVIDAVKVITGTNLTVRPTKIIAGHEPSKTNELLQAIGKALDRKLSSAEYVESLQKAGRKPKVTKTSTRENAPKAKTTSQVPQVKARAEEQEKKKKKTSSLASGANTKSSKLKNETSKKTEPVEEAQQPVQEAENQPIVQELPENNTEVEAQQEAQSPHVNEPEMTRPHSARRVHHKPSASTLNHSALDPNVSEDVEGNSSQNKMETLLDTEEKAQIQVSPQLAEMKIFGTDTSQREPNKKLPDIPVARSSVRPQTALRPQSARPPSARPAAPRIRDRGEIRITEESSSSPIGKVNVIADTEPTVEQDEDDTFIVMESQVPVVTQDQPPSPPPAADTKEQHGHLVTQILETQKELEDDGQYQSQNSQPKKVEIEWEAGRRRERELAGREIDRLRGSIQTLTRAANPLGKLMDFLQEDVDSMQHELAMWQRTNMDLMAQLRMEHSQTQQLTEPIKQHLQQLENSIQEQLNQLSILKGTVLQNDQHIQRLLTGGNISAVK